MSRVAWCGTVALAVGCVNLSGLAVDIPPVPGCGDTSGLQPRSPMPMYGQCASLRYRLPLPAPTGAPQPRWAMPYGANPDRAVLIAAGGTLVVETTKPSVLALSASDGTQRWEALLPAAPTGTSAIGADGNVYVAAGNELIGLRLSDGSASTPATLPGVATNVTLAPGGLILVTDDTMSLDAILPGGALAWTLPLGGSPDHATPAIGADGNIVLSADDGVVYRVTLDGSLVSTTPAQAGIDGDQIAVALDGTLRIWSKGAMHTLDASGSVTCSAPTAPMESFDLAVADDGTTIVGTSDAKLHAFDAGCNEVWAIGGGSFGTPTIASDGTILVGSIEGRSLDALSPQGALRWSVPLDYGVDAPPCIGADGSVYFVDTGGWVRAYD